jgi:hypothetical protein
MMCTGGGAHYGSANSPRPKAGARVSADKPDGMCLMDGRSVHAQMRRSSPTAPGFCFGRDLVEERSYGLSWDRHATQNTSKRYRAGER